MEADGNLVSIMAISRGNMGRRSRQNTSYNFHSRLKLIQVGQMTKFALPYETFQLNFHRKCTQEEAILTNFCTRCSRPLANTPKAALVFVTNMLSSSFQVIYMRLIYRLRRILAEILRIGHQGNQNIPEFHIVLILRLNQR